MFAGAQSPQVKSRHPDLDLVWMLDDLGLHELYGGAPAVSDRRFRISLISAVHGSDDSVLGVVRFKFTYAVGNCQ
jgi:hypothetical protein